MATITLIPNNENARNAFFKHIKNTSIKDRISMAAIGVKQIISTDGVISITINNMAIRLLSQKQPHELLKMLLDKKKNLTDDINKKFNLQEGNDYHVNIEVA